ncbi:MAG TPA: hypothetical protein PKM63_06580 [Panacibacter sp.]|nr:hypothetical protein [Panacibacter sp.]HNP43933.1 hypothetical protein [Panacibacter sp.]
MKEKEKAGRRRVSIWFLVILGVAIGFMIKNVEAGLVIGLIIGLLGGSLAGGKR